MSSSLKSTVFNALMKCATPKADAPEYDSAEAARDAFIQLVMSELFPESPSAPPEVTLPTVPESPAKKKRGAMSDEAKAAMKAKREATLAAKKAEVAPAPAPVAVPEPVAVPGEDSPGKRKRGPMSEEAKAAMKAKRQATLAAKKGVDEITEGIAAIAVAEKNLAKIDPTWRKHLKKVAGDAYKKEQEAGLLTFLNALTKDAFNAKKAEDHVKDFLAIPLLPASADDGKVEADLLSVEFNGKEYFVNEETKRVYVGEGTFDEEVGWTNYKPVGYVGMAAFAEMEL